MFPHLLTCLDQVWVTPDKIDMVVLIQRIHGLLSDTAQLFDALDAPANFEPIMQSVRDLNKLDDS